MSIRSYLINKKNKIAVDVPYIPKSSFDFLKKQYDILINDETLEQDHNIYINFKEDINISDIFDRIGLMKRKADFFDIINEDFVRYIYTFFMLSVFENEVEVINEDELPDDYFVVNK